MKKKHSPCIINLDDLGKPGTHWVCCFEKNKQFYYFDSFGMPPPLEWEKNLQKYNPKMKYFFRNNFPIQDILSLKCGYYCLCFLNEMNKGKKYKEILNMFSHDTKSNEKILVKYINTL